MADFKNLLKRAHLTLFNAFRAMDPKNKGYISRADYCKECQAIGFHNSKSVWNELSKDGNTIELGSLDPQAGHAFSLFSRCIFAKYRTLSECWKWAINASKNPRIGMTEFVRAVCSLNVDETTAKILFEYLQENNAVHEEAFMTIMRHWEEGSRVSDKFRAERFDLVATLTPATAVTEREFVTWAEHRWEKIELVFSRVAEVTRFEFEEHLRLLGYPHDEKAAGSLLVADGQNTILLRAFQRYKSNLRRSQDVAAYTKTDFFGLVRRRYGSLIAAWRQCFDSNNEGKIGFRPFCKHCHDLGFKGDVKVLWKSLVAKSGVPGFVDLAGLDPAGFNELTAFATMIFEENRNLNDAWRWSLNPEKVASVSFDTFSKYCTEQGFKGNVRQIFRALDHKGENFLTREGFDLLRHWDPSLPSLHKDARPKPVAQRLAQGSRDSTYSDDGHTEADDPEDLFTFQVVLGPVEYAEFLRKKANSRAADGSDHVPNAVRPIGLAVHAQFNGNARQGKSLESLLSLT